MKVESEITKIIVDNNLQGATIKIEYYIDDVKKLDLFKDKLTDFILALEGQKKIIS